MYYGNYKYIYLGGDNMITKKEFAALMDHTCLGTHVPKEKVKRFCEEVLKYGFAAIVVNPCDVSYAKSLLQDKAAVGTVIGFPQGVSSTKTKIMEGENAIDDGADELDIVINVSRLKDGDYTYVLNELTQFVKAMKAKKQTAVVKVIIECFYLTHAEKIKACELVIASGADYVKQSTGTTPTNSYTLGDTKLLNAIAGNKIKVKASGWINNIEDAIGCAEFGASRIGNSKGVQWLEEFDDNHWYDDVNRIK